MAAQAWRDGHESEALSSVVSIDEPDLRSNNGILECVHLRSKQTGVIVRVMINNETA